VAFGKIRFSYFFKIVGVADIAILKITAVMVIHSYHWLNSASRVLLSTCSAPLIQTGEHKQFSLFDLELWHTTLTYNPRLAKVKVYPHVKNQGQRSNGSNRIAPTDKWTYTHTDATKHIISPATRSIKWNAVMQHNLPFTQKHLQRDLSLAEGVRFRRSQNIRLLQYETWHSVLMQQRVHAKVERG